MSYVVQSCCSIRVWNQLLKIVSDANVCCAHADEGTSVSRPLTEKLSNEQSTDGSLRCCKRGLEPPPFWFVCLLHDLETTNATVLMKHKRRLQQTT